VQTPVKASGKKRITTGDPAIAERETLFLSESNSVKSGAF
jgi:hypothetical protein